MDNGYLFERGFFVRALSGESFLIEASSPIIGDLTRTQYAFTNLNDLMSFLLDQKDAFDKRKAPGA